MNTTAPSVAPEFPLSPEQLLVVRALVSIALGRDGDAEALSPLPTSTQRLLFTSAAVGEAESLPCPFATAQDRETAWGMHSATSRGELTLDEALKHAHENQRKLLLEPETEWVARSLVARILGKVHSRKRTLAIESRELRGATTGGEYSILYMVLDSFALAATGVEGFDLRQHPRMDPERLHARALMLHVLGFDLRVPTAYDAFQTLFHSVVPATCLRDYAGLAAWQREARYSNQQWSVNYRFGFGNPHLIGTYLAFDSLQPFLPAAQQEYLRPWGKLLQDAVFASWKLPPPLEMPETSRMTSDAA